MSYRDARYKFYRAMHEASKTAIEYGKMQERERLIKWLIDKGVIRRDAFGDLVAMDHLAENCVDLSDLEK